MVKAKKEPPTYHDLHITTSKMKRVSIMNLPFRVRVTCCRVAGWTVDALPERGLIEERIAGEYDDDGLRLDVAGHIIVDTLAIEP